MELFKMYKVDNLRGLGMTTSFRSCFSNSLNGAQKKRLPYFFIERFQFYVYDTGWDPKS